MRRLVWIFLLCSAWCEIAPPTVRAVLMEAEGQPAAEAQLKGYIEIVVCKSEYDAWVQEITPKPQIYLYLNGRVMKALDLEGPTTMSAIDLNDTKIDEDIRKVQSQCDEKAKAWVAKAAAAEKAASDRATTAAEALAAEHDPAKRIAPQDALTDAVNKATMASETTATRREVANRRYKFRYYLDPSPTDAKDLWVDLLERPWEERRVAVSAGIESGPPWPSDAKDIKFKRLNLGWLLGWAAIFVLAIFVFVRYARNSDIIRDPGTLPPPVAGVPPQQKAYSLARTQMALWTFLVAGALVFIFLVTWNENTINSGVLTLMGLSFGTTLLAATADATKTAPARGATPSAATADATKTAPARGATPSAAAPDATKTAPAPGTILSAATPDATKTDSARPTRGFVADLLFDGDGPSVHRYQMVLFTVVLAVIFVVKAATGLVMPEFDMTLLGLMGISNGTYLGFKLLGK
jgi:hypothetical protein